MNLVKMVENSKLIFLNLQFFFNNIFAFFLDIDECAVGGYCDGNAICANTIGSHECTCNSGFQGTGSPGDCVGECALVTTIKDYLIV